MRLNHTCIGYLYLYIRTVYLNRAVASEGAGGGGGGGGQLDRLSQRLNQVFVLGFSLFKGFVFFRLSYFDCSDLQLCPIFIARKSVGPRCVQMVSKTKQNSLLRLACTFARFTLV